MDVEKYKTKWGGEDWDLLDRILQVGLEAERIKIPGFYHFYHTKKDMWNNGKWAVKSEDMVVRAEKDQALMSVRPGSQISGILLQRII